MFNCLVPGSLEGMRSLLFSFLKKKKICSKEMLLCIKCLCDAVYLVTCCSGQQLSTQANLPMENRLRPREQPPQAMFLGFSFHCHSQRRRKATDRKTHPQVLSWLPGEPNTALPTSSPSVMDGRSPVRRQQPRRQTKTSVGASV